MSGFMTYGKQVTAVLHSHAGTAAFAQRVNLRSIPALVGGDRAGFAAWCLEQIDAAVVDGDCVAADKLYTCYRRAATLSP